jgi:hypothetical protein
VLLDKMADAPPVGYLVINVLEAAGHNQEDEKVWEPEFRAGYARGELLEGARVLGRPPTAGADAGRGGGG